MGSQLARYVLRECWTDEQLRGAPGRLLAAMADLANDYDPRPWCGVGDDYLAQRLGYPPDAEAGALAVRRARRRLVSLGYVDGTHEPVQNRRHKRRWVLTLPGYTYRPPKHRAPPTGHQ